MIFSEEKREVVKFRDPEMFPSMERAHAKAEDVYEDRIDYADFSEENGGPYAEDRIAKNCAYVEKMKRQFNVQNIESKESHSFGWETKSKLGKIFEAMVLDGIDMNAWFGDNAQIIIPTEYDDIANGIDGVVEFHAENSFVGHLALGIDVATSLEGVGKKLQKIKESIDRGQLSKMDYFHSETQGIKGQKNNIPQIILSADRQTIRELMDLWVEGEQKKLASHYIQFQILEEAMIQLKTFQKYAQAKGLHNLSELYQNDINCVQNVMMGKKSAFSTEELGQAIEEMKLDMGYQQIKKDLRIFEP